MRRRQRDAGADSGSPRLTVSRAQRAVASTGLAGARALFFAYFAYVGLLSPYLSLWLDDRGLSIVEIALILSLPQWLRVVAPPFWGWLSDRTGRRVALLRFSAVAALVLTLGFPFAHGLMPIALLLLALSFVTAAQGPIGEVLALEQARGDVGGYGRIRLWGSIGFVATVLIGGPALDRLGVSALPWLMACALVVLVCVSLCVPEPAAALARAARTSTGHTATDRLTIAVFFASVFLMIFAHAAMYSFWSIYLERLGYSRTAIGVIWSIGVLAEIALFAFQSRLFDRFSPLSLLGFSFAVCALRFAMVGLSDGALWVLVLTQLMHAVTFGLHHSASMAVLHRWFDPARHAQAQSAFIVCGYGLGGGIGGVFSGWLWERYSPAAAFQSAAVAALLGWAAISLVARRADRHLPEMKPVGGGRIG